MQITIEELTALITAKSGQCAQPSAPKSLGCQIVVADRGFVYVGQTTVDGEYARITNARNIRIWGTTKGLGELVSGPTDSTKLDEVGEVILPLRAIIHFIKCTRDW